MTVYRRHAIERMAARGIARHWVEAALASPDWEVPNGRPGVTRTFQAIAEAGGRILRVVHRHDGADIVVITALFDRNARQP